MSKHFRYVRLGLRGHAGIPVATGFTLVGFLMGTTPPHASWSRALIGMGVAAALVWPLVLVTAWGMGRDSVGEDRDRP